MLSVVIGTQALIPTFVDIPTVSVLADTTDDSDDSDTTYTPNADGIYTEGYYTITSGGTIKSYTGPTGGSITIPATVADITVVSIGTGNDTSAEGIFNGANFQHVTFEDASTITTIGSFAFANNDLISFEMPNSLYGLGPNAFLNAFAIIPQLNTHYTLDLSHCTELKIITDYAFSANPFTQLILPPNVTTIGVGAFQYCNFSSVTLPDTLISIGLNAFQDNNLLAIALPPNLQFLLRSGETYQAITSEVEEFSLITNYDISVPSAVYVPSQMITNYDFETQVVTIDWDQALQFYGLKNSDGTYPYDCDQTITFTTVIADTESQGYTGNAIEWWTDSSTSDDPQLTMHTNTVYVKLGNDLLIGYPLYEEPIEGTDYTREYYGYRQSRTWLSTFTATMTNSHITIVADKSLSGADADSGNNDTSVYFVDDYMAIQVSTPQLLKYLEDNNIDESAISSTEGTYNLTLPYGYDLDLSSAEFVSMVQVFAMYGGRMKYSTTVTGDGLSADADITNTDQLEPGVYEFSFYSYDYGKQWNYPEVMQTTAGATPFIDNSYWQNPNDLVGETMNTLPSQQEIIDAIDTGEGAQIDDQSKDYIDTSSLLNSYSSGVMVAEEQNTGETGPPSGGGEGPPGGGGSSSTTPASSTLIQAPYTYAEYLQYESAAYSSQYFYDGTKSPVSGYETFRITITQAQVTITFDTMGAYTPTPAAQTTVQYGLSTFVSEEPKKSGYDFVGWYTTPTSGGYFWTFDERVTQSLTLYARWVPSSYPVSFDAEGGSPTPTTQTVLFLGVAIYT
ncbi:MAG: hypothetical protein ATN35_12865 [Epulopiscium sp. Nele67-Bin004]|nr:MAG: hypothetical protein ATN35_12865 [Epulopiscium sp. Nele67-Bin004]